MLDLNRMTDLDEAESTVKDWDFCVLLKNNWKDDYRGIKLVQQLGDYGVL